MRYEKNIEHLKMQLVGLGFDEGLENELYAKICFRPAKFDVAYRLMREHDTVNYTLMLERDVEEQYQCLYYDACLRKNITVPDTVAGDTDIVALNNIMNTVNWDFSGIADRQILVETANQVDEVLNDLQLLSGTVEGRKMADLLKFKHWSDTPIEYLFNGLGAFKTQYEITQRFYLAEGQGITTEEAYRFLCNRWVERKLLAKRKEGNISKAETEGGPAIAKKRKLKR